MKSRYVTRPCVELVVRLAATNWDRSKLVPDGLPQLKAGRPCPLVLVCNRMEPHPDIGGVGAFRHVFRGGT